VVWAFKEGEEGEEGETRTRGDGVRWASNVVPNATRAATRGGRTSEEKLPRARAAPLFAPHERLQRLFHRETHGTRGPARAREVDVNGRETASFEFFFSRDDTIFCFFSIINISRITNRRVPNA
jgi:hypothetical protein